MKPRSNPRSLARSTTLGLWACWLSLGCRAPGDDCVEHPQWCGDFSVVSLGAVNRADPLATVSVRVATNDATPSYETHFRASFELTQTGRPPIGRGTDLPPPQPLPTGDTGWAVPLSRFFADPQTRLNLPCGPAKLYLHARLRSQPTSTPLTPSSDPDSATFQQHALTDLAISDDRPPTFLAPTAGPAKLPGGASLSTLGLHPGTPFTLYASLDQILGTSQAQLGVGTLDLQTGALASVTTEKNYQFVGETSAARLLVKLAPSAGTCGIASAFAAACAQLDTATAVNDPAKCFSSTAPLAWCFPARSTAAASVDPAGGYFAAVDGPGNLHVHNLSLNLAAKTLSTSEWTSLAFPGFFLVTSGDLDADGSHDLLALRQNLSPLLLFRQSNTFNSSSDKQTLSQEWAARLDAHPQARSSDAVAAIGPFDHCDPGPDVLLASGGTVFVFPNPTQADPSFVKKPLSLPGLPPGSTITALLLADTNADKAADLLLVAAKPDTIYVYSLH